MSAMLSEISLQLTSLQHAIISKFSTAVDSAYQNGHGTSIIILFNIYARDH